jgi:hypothetical protein
LRNFGLKVGIVGTVKFEARIKELVDNFADLAAGSNRCSLSGARFASSSVSCIVAVLAIVRSDDVCRRLMTTPGVGPVAALDSHGTTETVHRTGKGRRGHLALGKRGSALAARQLNLRCCQIRSTG